MAVLFGILGPIVHAESGSQEMGVHRFQYGMNRIGICMYDTVHMYDKVP